MQLIVRGSQAGSVNAVVGLAEDGRYHGNNPQQPLALYGEGIHILAVIDSDKPFCREAYGLAEWPGAWHARMEEWLPTISKEQERNRVRWIGMSRRPAGRYDCAKCVDDSETI